MYWLREMDNQLQKRETHENRLRKNIGGSPKMWSMNRIKKNNQGGRGQKVQATNNNTWESREARWNNRRTRRNTQVAQRDNRQEPDYSRRIRINRGMIGNEKSYAKLEKNPIQLQKVSQLLERMIQERNVL